MELRRSEWDDENKESTKYQRLYNTDHIMTKHNLQWTTNVLHLRQVHKSVLPLHSVYILGMERISSRLWHPSWGEVEQEAMAAQEASLRDTLKEHRLAANPVNWTP